MWLALLPEIIGWYEERRFTGLTCKMRNGRFLLILHAQGHKGPECAFFNGESLFDALAVMAAMAKGGQIRWLTDKYPPDVGT